MSASLFGTGSPQLIVSGPTTITLDYAILDPQWVDNQLKEFVSIINGTRRYIRPHYYSNFDIELLLYKNASPRTTFLTLDAYLYQEVTFKPYEHDDDTLSSDGKTMKDENGDDLVFTFTNYQVFLTEPNTQFDKMIITLRSKTYSSMTQTYT